MSGVEIQNDEVGVEGEVETTTEEKKQQSPNSLANMIITIIIACLIYFLMSLKIVETGLAKMIPGFYETFGLSNNSNITDNTLKSIVETYASTSNTISMRGRVIQVVIFGMILGIILYMFA